MYFGESATQQLVTESFLGEVGYFNNTFVEQKFAKAIAVGDDKLRSRLVSKAMYEMVMNISAVCTRAVKLYELYQLNYQYNNIISTYFTKYMPYVTNPKDIARVKSAIEQSFVGANSDKWIKFGVGIVTNFIIPGEFKFINDWVAKVSAQLGKTVANVNIDKGIDPADAIKAGMKASQTYYKYAAPAINGLIRFIPQQELTKLFFFICPIKFQSVGEALVSYKRSSEPGVLQLKDTTDAAKYCFDITFSVLQDIMNVYKDL